MVLKRRDSARSGDRYYEVSQVIQKKSRPSSSKCVTPFAYEPLHEQVFTEANVVGCRASASHFPSDKVQGGTEIRGRTPVSANNRGKNTTAMTALIEFTCSWFDLTIKHLTSHIPDADPSQATQSRSGVGGRSNQGSLIEMVRAISRLVIKKITEADWFVFHSASITHEL